jgi:hypothetical protein
MHGQEHQASVLARDKTPSVPNDNSNKTYNLGYHGQQPLRGLVVGQIRMSPISPVRHVQMPAMHTASAGDCRRWGSSYLLRANCGLAMNIKTRRGEETYIYTSEFGSRPCYETADGARM